MGDDVLYRELARLEMENSQLKNRIKVLEKALVQIADGAARREAYGLVAMAHTALGKES